MFRQYVENPKGFAYSRRLCMSLPYAGFVFSFKQAVHYVSSCLIAKDGQWFKNSPRKGLTLCAVPVGLLLMIYIKIRAKKDE
jgi:hypothetical protein